MLFISLIEGKYKNMLRDGGTCEDDSNAHTHIYTHTQISLLLRLTSIF